MFFTTIANVIPAIELLTENMNKELQKHLWNTVEKHPAKLCKKTPL